MPLIGDFVSSVLRRISVVASGLVSLLALDFYRGFAGAFLAIDICGAANSQALPAQVMPANTGAGILLSAPEMNCGKPGFQSIAVEHYRLKNITK